MQLSVIIVNYNVKHFLEQCLYSVQKAAKGINAEIIVVDNHSTDNSIPFLQKSFPCIKIICNKENRGFAVACNQGYAIAKGQFILFLNPDCIVPEDCFEKTISFFEQQPQAGAIGVRMVDGHGRFLKESKRAFPSPLTSLFKLLGLARLFPHSKLFAQYHLGHLKENENHEVDVLAGAFMMVRKEVLEKTGSFDESFFMYGEDVDLSYRIQEAGYKNYYVADTSIMHFKGESTKKGSLNYVRMFYKAMSVFVSKHYGGGKAGLFGFFIHLAIWCRAGLSAVSRFIRLLGLPVIDGLLIFFSFSIIKTIWMEYVKVNISYPGQLLMIAFPVFTAVYLLVAYYGGLYDKQYKPSGLIRSTFISTLVLLAGYSLLPEHYRFSRGIVFFGALLAFFLISIFRALLVKQQVIYPEDEKKQLPQILVAGTEAEYDELMNMLEQAGNSEKVLGRLSVSATDKNAIAFWKQLDVLKASVPYREIIFCAGVLPYKEIIDFLPALPERIKVKLHTAGSSSIVGSDSKDSAGEAVSKENGFRLSRPYYRRIKRLTDLILSIFFLLIFPLHFILQKKPFVFLQRCVQVLLGQKTWVGYLIKEQQLPSLRPGVIGNNGISLSISPPLPAESMHAADHWYAKEYEPLNEIGFIFRHYHYLCT